MKMSKGLRNSRGSADMLLIIMMIGLGAAAITTFLHFMTALQKSSATNVNSALKNIDNESAMETFLQAYRHAQITYLRATAACGTANPMIAAMKLGTGCPGVSATIFSGSASAQDPGVVDNIYSYPGDGCTIGPASSDCADTAPVVTIGEANDAQRIGGRSYRISLVRPWPEMQMIEFQLVDSSGGALSQTVNFFMNDSIGNTAHFEQDGRVVQENPQPMQLCHGVPWGNYQLYIKSSNSCVDFIQLGGGTGMAYYRNHFFGFRPMDGSVIDLQNIATHLPTYFVNPSDGRIAGISEPIFVPFPNPAFPLQSLVNVDDITVVDNQIYYVAGQGTNAHIGYGNPNGQRVRVCELGTLGWAQAYSGIAALGWSDALVADTANPLDPYLTQRFAQFLLKTDSGDLLSAAVYTGPTGQLECAVVRDKSLQQVEYSRTLGFDRAQPVKPFYVF